MGNNRQQSTPSGHSELQKADIGERSASYVSESISRDFLTAGYTKFITHSAMD